jgi:hypothetical protein
MPLVTFLTRSGTGTFKTRADERSQDGIAIAFYNNPVEASSLGVGEVTQNSDTIGLNKWTDLRNRINDERQRRGQSQLTFSSIDRESKITPTHFNELRTAASVAGRFTNDILGGRLVTSDSAYEPNLGINDVNGQAIQPSTVTYTAPGAIGMPSAATLGSTITAALINGVIRGLNSGSGVCVCNCNYCTCNCNYCTCNCNYSCTCNCNYSDIRLKTNILFSHIVDGLKIYEFSYKWNTNKKYLGVMAQHLFGTKYENAIMKNNDGIYMVDYSKLPFAMKEIV